MLLIGALPAKAYLTIGDFTCIPIPNVPGPILALSISGYNGAGGVVEIPDTLADLPVTSIEGAAFRYKTNITSVTIPSSVTSIGGQAFYGCSGMVSVTIGNGVTSVGYKAFEACTKLASVSIGNSVKTISGYAFSGCSSLTSITIPHSVSMIEMEAFSNCTNLASVTIPSSVTSVGQKAFYYCTSLASISFNGNAPYLGASALDTLTNTLVYYFVGTIGWQNAQSSFGGLTAVALGPPVISEQPFSVIANLGESIEFSVLASNAVPLPLTYQWKKNGVNIQGATTATLSIDNVQGNNAGSYFVEVTNQYGRSRSSNASLTLSQGNLYTQAQFDAAVQTGFDLGVKAVSSNSDILANPNAHGLYSLSQVQALHVGTPLLAKDLASGKFKLTVGVAKSTDLINFSPMPIEAGGATINADGKMEYQFTAPDNAAFYRLESR